MQWWVAVLRPTPTLLLRLFFAVVDVVVAVVVVAAVAVVVAAVAVVVVAVAVVVAAVAEACCFFPSCFFHHL